MSAIPTSACELRLMETAREISARGRSMGLPLVATWADISSARPATVGGDTAVSSLFEFAADAREYWLQGDLALQNAIVTIVRWSAEPFYYDRGEIGGWRPFKLSPELAGQIRRTGPRVYGSIVAPVHLPGGVIGAVVWASDEARDDVPQLFAQYASELHVLALRFITTCNASMHGEPNIRSYRLTRREIQCLKLAAAGKTDEEIGTILDLSIPTIRFHLRKAGDKLGESGRLRIVHHAAALGFVSMRL